MSGQCYLSILRRIDSSYVQHIRYDLLLRIYMVKLVYMCVKGSEKMVYMKSPSHLVMGGNCAESPNKFYAFLIKETGND